MKIRAAVSPVLNKLKARVAFFAVAMAVTLGMMNARIGYAQNASQVTVPFAFSANHQVFPAGHYRVSRESDSYLIVRSTDTGVGAGLMVRTMRTLEPTGKNSLVFYHDASGYRLLTVRFAQGGLQTDLSVQPKSEREIAKATAGASTEVGMN
jgi:hypothetical protein